MASGKQLSFAYGEVSPSYRYKSSTVAYNEGLHKLRNGFPRVGGGVSNRSGFKFIKSLPSDGVRPKGIQSDTKLIFNKRREYLGEDRSKKHSGDTFFFYKNDSGRVALDVIKSFSNFSLTNDEYLYQARVSDEISTVNTVVFEDDIYISLRDIGILRFPYEKLFTPRQGENKLVPVGGNLSFTNEETVQAEVVSDYFYKAPDIAGPVSNPDYRPFLSVQMEGGGPPNSSISAAYVISEEKTGSPERVLCAYHGIFTSFQGVPVIFRLVDDGGVTWVGHIAHQQTSADIINLWKNYRKRGFLHLRRDGLETISRLNDGSVLPSSGESDSTRYRFNHSNTGGLVRVVFNKVLALRPSKGRYVYRLYRGFSIGSPLSLIDVSIVDFEDLNAQPGSGFESYITLRDSSSSSGAVSRSFRDGLRLYGGSGNDELDTRFYEFKQVDYGFFNGGHRFYRPDVPTANGQGSRFIPFVRVRELMRYQQRTFASYIDRGPLDSENTLRSVIGVSKINTKHDFATAPVVNPANAFEFNIPLGDVSPVVAMLGADRPLIFTLNNVYMLLGTDSGIITPTEINPTVVYTGGCSETVRPVLVDNRAFFLNNDHSSLVMIAFNASGGRGVQVIETDQRAKHFLEMNITQIVVVKSFDTIVWLLTSEGSLISITSHSEDTFGFALHTLTDGFIENITAAKYPYVYHPTTKNNAWTVPDVEVLAATIVRDGQRTLEVMTGRDDFQSENMGFMDGQVTFGTRLTARDDGYRFDLERPFGRYYQVYDPPMTSEMASDLNTIFTKFQRVERSINWFRHLFSETGPNERSFPYNDDNALLYERGGFVRTPFNNLDALGGSQYARRDYVQRVSVGEQVSSLEGIRYLVDFRTNPSVFSLLPTRLTGYRGSGSSSIAARQSAGTPITQTGSYLLWDMYIYVYLHIIRAFYGINAITNVPYDARTSDAVTANGYDTLNDRQKSLVDKMVTEGGILNFNAPEEMVYNGVHLKKRDQDELRFNLGHVNLFLYDLTPVGPGGDVATGTSVNTRIKNLFAFRKDGKIISARIPIPNTIGSSEEIPVPNPLVQVTYEALGNERIPGQYINVGANPNLQEETKFRYSTNWASFVNRVENLTHLANKKVAVFADNEVVSSPLSEKPTVAEKALTVNNAGVLELPNHYQWGMVGLPYKFEMETLQIETQDDKALISGRKMINKLNVALNRTREGARSSSIRGFEYNEKVDASYPIIKENVRDESIDKKNGTFSGVVESVLSSGWSEGGRVRITNADPTPITVNAIYPKGIESGD